MLLSSRALTAAESRRQPFCVKEGTAYLPASSRFVKRLLFEAASSRTSSGREGDDFYFNPPRPVKPSRLLLFFTGPARGLLLLRPCLRPVKEKYQELRTLLPGPTVSRARLLPKGLRRVKRAHGTQGGFSSLSRPARQTRVFPARCEQPRQPPEADAPSPPIRARPQRPLAQSPASTASRRQRAAAALPAGSGRPPRSARSWRTIASSRA